jgi:hypothetical protein
VKAILLAAFVLLGARAGFGCSCAGPNPVCSVFWTTGAVFLGHVVRIDRDPGQLLVHFDVTKVYRGSRSEQVVIHTPDQGPACGFAFERGRDYVVYASAGSNGDLATSHCTRTHEVISREDDADLQWMEGLAQSPAGASIFGRIRMQKVNRDGSYDTSGLARVAVKIQGPDSKTVSTDAEGKFRVDGLAPGKYVVSAKAPNGYSAFEDWKPALGNRTCAEVVWSTRLDGHIRGKVYFKDGTPAAGLFLQTKAADAVPGEPWTWKETTSTTGPDGAFDFAPLSPGSYVFGVNLDFSSIDGKYYRKAFFPGTSKRGEAATITLGAGEMVGDLSFYLPADSPPPSIPVSVLVIGFDGRPVSRAEITAEDDMWENSVTSLAATTDENGKAIVALRPGSHYDIEAFVNLADSTQACAEPVGVDARDETRDQPAAIVLKLSHPFGNCMQFRKAGVR